MGNMIHCKGYQMNEEDYYKCLIRLHEAGNIESLKEMLSYTEMSYEDFLLEYLSEQPVTLPPMIFQSFVYLLDRDGADVSTIMRIAYGENAQMMMEYIENIHKPKNEI